MPAAARITDLHSCRRTSKGQIISGASTVFTEGFPAARVGDQAACAGGTDVIIQGCATVFIEGKPAARKGDAMANKGVIISGASTVFIGAPVQGECLRAAAGKGFPFIKF